MFNTKGVTKHEKQKQSSVSKSICGRAREASAARVERMSKQEGDVPLEHSLAPYCRG